MGAKTCANVDSPSPSGQESCGSRERRASCNLWWATVEICVIYGLMSVWDGFPPRALHGVYRKYHP